MRLARRQAGHGGRQGVGRNTRQPQLAGGGHPAAAGNKLGNGIAGDGGILRALIRPGRRRPVQGHRGGGESGEGDAGRRLRCRGVSRKPGAVRVGYASTDGRHAERVARTAAGAQPADGDDIGRDAGGDGLIRHTPAAAARAVIRMRDGDGISHRPNRRILGRPGNGGGIVGHADNGEIGRQTRPRIGHDDVESIVRCTRVIGGHHRHRISSYLV